MESELEVPGEPAIRICSDEGVVSTKGNEIIKNVYVIHASGFNDAHENVADPGADLGFVEHGDLAPKDTFFQKPFDFAI